LRPAVNEPREREAALTVLGTAVERTLQRLAGELLARLAGEELADLQVLVPRLWRRQGAVILRLECLLLHRVAQQVLPVDEDVDVAVLGQRVGLAGPAKVELPEGRDYVAQVRVALLDVRVERQQIAVAREVPDV